MRQRRIGILPARANSKRIPGKNLKPLGGHPLLAWVLAAARAARLDVLLVSSDSAAILDAADAAYGAPMLKVLRPSPLATDTTPDFPVFDHALRAWPFDGSETVLHLRATAPFVRPAEIHAVAEALEQRGCGSVRSVVPLRHHPRKVYLEGWPYKGHATLRPATHWHAANEPSQTLEPAWAAAGFVDAILARVILVERRMEGTIIGRWVAPAGRAIELDTEDDWAVAEDMIRRHGWRPGNV